MARPLRHRAITTVVRAYSRDPLDRIASIGGVNRDHTTWHLSQPPRPGGPATNAGPTITRGHELILGQLCPLEKTSRHGRRRWTEDAPVESLIEREQPKCRHVEPNGHQRDFPDHPFSWIGGI